MKEFKMRSFFFKLKYVYRNITRNSFRSLSLFLSIFMLSFIVLTAFTIKSALSTGYYLYEDVKHENIDIVVTFDSNSKNYLIDDSKISKINHCFEYYGSYFEMSTLIKKQDNQLSAMVLGGASEELSDFVGTELPHLQYNEVIINKTVASKLNLNVDDSIEIYIGSIPYNYKVVHIVEDRSFFEQDKILVQKEFYVKEYAKLVLNMDISDYSDINLSTSIYIKLKEGYSKTEIIEFLKNENYYPSSLVHDPREYEAMKADVEMGTGILYAAIAIFIAALLFVLISIINLRIKTFKNEVGIIETLGENKTYVFKLLMYEIAMLAIIGLVLAYLLSNYIYTKEFEILSTKGTYHFDYKWWHFFGTYFVVIVICGLTLLKGYYRYKQLSTIDLAKNKQYDKVLTIKQIIIFNIIMLILCLIDCFILRRYLPLMISSILGILIYVIFGIVLVSLVVRLICKLFHHDKVFIATFLRSLNINKLKHNSLKILLVCLFGIVMCFVVIENIDETLSKVENSLNIDNILISPKGVNEEVVDYIKSFEAVDAATLGFFEDKVSTKDDEYTFLVVFSCDASQTEKFMNFKVDEDLIQKFSSNNKCVIVMEDFLIASGLSIGDQLIFNLNNGAQSYEIVGTANLPFQQFAYTNDYYLDDIFLNTVLIDNDLTNESGMNEFRMGVTKKYGTDICVLYNAGTYLTTFFSRARIALDVVYSVIAIVIVCFIVSIINNTILDFNEIKRDLAIIQILGISINRLRRMIILEIVISYLSIFASLLMMIYGVSIRFGGLSLLCGYYLDLYLNPVTIIGSIILGMFCFILSYIYYFIGSKKINVCEELKK